MEIKLRFGGEDLAPMERILYLRGTDMHFLHPSQADELDYHDLDNIELAARRILKALVRQEQVYVQVDSDCDGYTSAALLLNYLHDIAPTTVESKWKYGLHKAKLHGIDVENIPSETKLVIAPDSSSNELEKHQVLVSRGMDVIVLDHHEASGYESDPAIIVNNQLSGYGNKTLSGVGVVYKTLQCMDNLQQKPGTAARYLDLVALGLTGDMMDMRSPETNYYITEGFKEIHNPFFVYLADKNEFSMKGKCTPHSVAWFIVPFINAVTRIGSDEDKLLVFESMLSWKAGQLILSDKRGARNGQEELRVEQAVRHAANIKRHQDDEKKKLLDEMNLKIEKYNLADEPLIIIQNKGVQDDDPIRGITGLVANSIMAQYNKPTLILNEVVDENGETYWSGSGRGFATSGINNWRDYIASTGTAIFAQGHGMAFGVAFTVDGLEDFKNRVRSRFGRTIFEKTYEVDFVWTMVEDFDSYITEIAYYRDVWGQGVPEPLVAIEHIKLDDPITVNLLAKGTLRIDLKPHETSIIKFGSNIEEYQELLGKTITVIGTCDINDWGGKQSPQIKIVDYFFETVSSWDF